MADIAADTQRGWEPAAIPTETFGQRLRYIRLMLDESVTSMAKLIGVPGQTWGTWEEGVTPRKVHDIVRQVVDATHDRFAPEAPASAMRDWLIWGPMSRCFTEHPGQGHLFPTTTCLVPLVAVAA
jgi:hypothetical protein